MTYLSGAAGQTNYQRTLPKGVPGMRHGVGALKSLPFYNNAGMTAPTYTITPPATVDTSGVYAVTVNGLAVSVTADASPTTAELGLLLYNALITNPQIGRLANISLVASTGVITLVSTLVNTALTIVQTNSGTTTNDLTIANTVAVGTGTNIPPGRAVGTLSSYVADRDGYYPAALISHASNFTFKGFTELRVQERTTIGNDAEAAYKPGQVMSVLTDCGTMQGMWVEASVTGIVPTDTCYVDITTGNEGKVTKTAGSNMNIGSTVKFMSNSETSNGKYIVLVYYRA